MKLLVIADDFTGANDTGVQFAKKHARTEILDNTQNILGLLMSLCLIQKVCIKCTSCFRKPTK